MFNHFLQCNLKVNPKVRFEGPEIVEKLFSRTEEVKSTFRLYVRARGKPMPNLTWLKVNAYLELVLSCLL